MKLPSILHLISFILVIHKIYLFVIHVKSLPKNFPTFELDLCTCRYMNEIFLELYRTTVVGSHQGLLSYVSHVFLG